MRIGKFSAHPMLHKGPRIGEHIVHKTLDHQKMACYFDEVPEICPYKMNLLKHHKKHKMLHKKHHHHHRFHPTGHHEMPHLMMHPEGPHMKHHSSSGPHHVSHPGGHHHLMHSKGPGHHMRRKGHHHHMHPKGPHHHMHHGGHSLQDKHKNHHHSSSSSSSSSESEDEVANDVQTNIPNEQDNEESIGSFKPPSIDGCKCQRKLEKMQLKRKNKIEKNKQKSLRKENKIQKKQQKQHKPNTNENVSTPEHEKVAEEVLQSSAEQEDSLTSPHQTEEDLHVFMKGVSNQVKNLSPEMVALAKMKILQAVNNLQLNEDSNASTSKEQGTADNKVV